MNHFTGLSSVFFLCLPQKRHRANYGVNRANYGGNRANNGKSCKVWVYIVLTMGNRENYGLKDFKPLEFEGGRKAECKKTNETKSNNMKMDKIKINLKWRQ